ncbi:MAG: hydrogenase maturation protease [Candidatus Lokiarchaeota archaeon]|nr:hydrogenase maturation protease [Candidatus Lokiarchaeota archaeon]MBD3199514.1 hydrogenase maturation protease [Candidatus Lokiarchaeota archaeon]
MKDLYDKLFNRLKDAKKIVFMGLGEEKMQDDGIGPYIITELLSHSSDKVLFINAGIDPLARVQDITNFNPTHLVILDTCTLSREPGTVALIEREHMVDLVPISSHTIPIHVVIDYLKAQTPELTDVFMIGFVPKSIDGFTELTQYKEGELTIDDINENEDLPFFNFQLTEVIQKTADQMIDMIKKLIAEI